MGHTPSFPRMLFAYGTLMSTITTELGWREREAMSSKCRLIGRGRLRGHLYDVGACPGAVATQSARGFVRGELWLMPSRAERLLALLDRYEGCQPGAELPLPYRRSVGVVEHELGWEMTAWMYVWNRETRGLRAIRSGVWEPSIAANSQPDGRGSRSGSRDLTAAMAVADKAA